jgi:hypothetical protein
MPRRKEASMNDKVSFSPFGSTGLGLHLTINPEKKPKAKTTLSGQAELPDNDIAVRAIYQRHGLRLGDKELQALKQSRPQGVQAIDFLLSRTPGFADLNKDQRLNLAMTAADFLLEKAVEAKLSREVPTALDEEEQTAQRLNAIFQNMGGRDVKKGSAPSLLESVPVGVSVTVHWSLDWLDSK